MRCPKCKAELEEDAVFCTNCGIEIESYIKWSPDYQEKPKKNLVSLPAEQENFEKQEKAKDFQKFKNKNFRNSLNELLPKSIIPLIIMYSGICSSWFF